MPAGMVKTKRDEAAWKKAKEIAKKAHKGGNYRYITAIYKSLSIDPETLDMNVPTMEGEDIMETIESLKESIGNFILDCCVPELMRESAWVCIESLTETAAIAEVKGCGEEDLYYSVGFNRLEDGSYEFSEPVQVNEVKTYEPVPVPELAPVSEETLSRVVLCESMSIHAPPADGLTKGRPVQLLRNGQLFDLDSGEFVLDVTDELCKEIKLSASIAGFGIPIDFGHALYRAQVSGSPQEDVSLYGRIMELEDRPGEGLWGTPEWSQSGIDLLNSKPGMLYLSPTLMGTPYNPNSGEPMGGRSLHSVSITATPRQNGLSSLALSRNPNQEETKDMIMLSKVDHAALLEKVALFDQKVTELTKQLEDKTNEVNDLNSQVQEFKKDAQARDFNDLVLSFDAKGVVVSNELKSALSTLGLEQAKTILSQMPATRPQAPIGSGGVVKEPVNRTEEQIVADAHAIMAAARKDGKTIEFTDAVKLSRKGV